MNRDVPHLSSIGRKHSYSTEVECNKCEEPTCLLQKPTKEEARENSKTYLIKQEAPKWLNRNRLFAEETARIRGNNIGRPNLQLA